MKKLLFLFLFIPVFVNAQKLDSLKSKQCSKGILFSNIYADFNYSKSDKGINSGFGMPTALFGYTRKLGTKVSGTIIFDVTRTTSNIQVFDTNGTYFNVTYFEGSKYTAFLKMAEIKWNISPKLSLSVGQLLNTQYLTLQDKFWQHRYVEVTFQELNRLGMPADFGMRFCYKPTKKLKLFLSAFNGEGPFRHQDKNSNFLISTNIEYRPNKNIILKSYYSEYFCGDTTLRNQSTLSLFWGYRLNKITLGLEYDMIENEHFSATKVNGFSGFIFYDFTKKLQIFYRYDFLAVSSFSSDMMYHIVGLQYKPVDKFFVSVNYRYKTVNNEKMFFLNFGLKI